MADENYSEVNSTTYENGTPLISTEVLKRREIKWQRMLNEWDDFYTRFNYTKIKERCYKGIPPSVRPQAWFYLCCDQNLIKAYHRVFEYLLNLNGDPKCIKNIKQDLNRRCSHPTNCFENICDRKALFQLLKVYSILNDEVGYRQAQAKIAAFLLIHMPIHQAFWCLVFLCNKYLYGYHNQGEEIVFQDGYTLMTLLKKVSPKAYKHLKTQKIQPTTYIMEWFPCAYTRVLPWNTLLRVWDIFLYEGIKVLFKVALVLLKGCFGSSSLRKTCPTAVESLQLLKNPPPHIIEEKNLINQIKKLNLKDKNFPCERPVMPLGGYSPRSPNSDTLQLLKIMLTP